jgi:hypothetical protein
MPPLGACGSAVGLTAREPGDDHRVRGHLRGRRPGRIGRWLGDPGSQCRRGVLRLDGLVARPRQAGRRSARARRGAGAHLGDAGVSGGAIAVFGVLAMWAGVAGVAG